MIGSQLVENAWPLKPITFEEIIIFICDYNSNHNKKKIIIIPLELFLLLKLHELEIKTVEIILE